MRSACQRYIRSLSLLWNTPVKSPANAYCGTMYIFSATFHLSFASTGGLSARTSSISGPSPDYEPSGKDIFSDPEGTVKLTCPVIYEYLGSAWLSCRGIWSTYIPYILLLPGKSIKGLHQHNRYHSSHQVSEPLSNPFSEKELTGLHTPLQSSIIPEPVHRPRKIKYKPDPFRLELGSSQLGLFHPAPFVHRRLSCETFGEPAIVELAVGLTLEPNAFLLLGCEV